MALNDWKNPRTALAWSTAVNTHGDIFQATLTVPYFLAVADYAKATGGRGLGLLPPPADVEGITERFYANLEHFWKAADKGEASLADHITQQFAIRDYTGLTMLDLGCGEGFLSRLFVEGKGQAFGIDGSEELIRLARNKKRTLVDKQRQSALQFSPEELEKFLAPEAAPLGNPDLVVISNVFDHFGRLENVLEALAQRLGDGAGAPLVMAATLNPDFFFGPKQWDIRVCPERPEKAVLGPASLANLQLAGKSGQATESVDVWPRPWQRFERLFANAGFHVLSCESSPLCLTPDSLRSRYVESAGIKRAGDWNEIPTATPFVLWTLLPYRWGRTVPFEEVQKELKESKYSCTLAKNGSAQQALEKYPARKVSFQRGERLAFAQNLGGHCFLVTKGYARMVSRVGSSQVFDKESSPFIGELETGDDIYGSRYIYDVYAGDGGCEALLINRHAFEGLMDENREGLGAQLYKELRDRLTAFSWIYHHSGEQGKRLDTLESRQQPGSAPAEKGGKNSRQTTRNYEYFSRVLLFTASVECRTNALSNGSVIFLNEAVVSPLFGSNSSFGKMCTTFSQAGIIDAFGGPKMPTTAIAKAYESHWQEMCEAAMQAFVYRKFGIDPAHPALSGLTRVEVLRHDRQLFDPKGRRSATGEGRDFTLVLTKAARDLAEELARKIISVAPKVDSQVARAAARQLVANLAFLQTTLFKASSPMVFVINDVRLLREIAYDSRRFHRRVGVRCHLSEAFTPPQEKWQEREFRLQAYLKRSCTYAKAIWDGGMDLGFSTDKYLKRELAVAAAVKTWY